MNASESTSKRSGPPTSKSSPPVIAPDPSSEDWPIEISRRSLIRIPSSSRRQGLRRRGGPGGAGGEPRRSAAPAGPPASRLHGYRDRRLVLLQTEGQSASDDQIAVEDLERKPRSRDTWTKTWSRLGAPVELPVGALDRDVVQHHGARKPAPGAAPGDAELLGLAVDDPVGRRAREKPVGGAQVRAVRERARRCRAATRMRRHRLRRRSRFHSLNIRVALDALA